MVTAVSSSSTNGVPVTVLGSPSELVWAEAVSLTEHNRRRVAVHSSCTCTGENQQVQKRGRGAPASSLFPSGGAKLLETCSSCPDSPASRWQQLALARPHLQNWVKLEARWFVTSELTLSQGGSKKVCHLGQVPHRGATVHVVSHL